MAGRFSLRTGWDTRESTLARAVRERLEAGCELIDLTVSNPTLCGFEYDAAAILGSLGDGAALVYDPDARGIQRAREAVAEYYAGHEAAVDPDRMVLTTSTSEAYSFLFRLLCDPGDAVLVAQPSYPLFDFLAGLDDVRLVPYPLFHDFGWWIDFAELERRIDSRTRAIVVVHPNNPTGHATGAAERTRLEAICARHGLALIVDEVFLDYGLDGRLESFATGENECLTFVVSGLSKIAALPQMKVGWLVCRGREDLVQEAMARLEVVADTFLSLNAPAQHALPAWLAGSAKIQSQITARIRENLAVAKAVGLELLKIEAGWSGVLVLPPCDEDVAVRLVQEAGVVVQPGSFYAMAGRRYGVLSMIGPVDGFAKGVNILRDWREANSLT